MTDVVMPQMGESIVEGTLTKWLKKPGDRVERDEPLFEISTDKVDTEIPAPAAGTLAEILVEQGQTVAINTVVARIDETGVPVGQAPGLPVPPVEPPPVGQAPGLPTPPVEPPPPIEEPAGSLSPLVRRMAREHNIDLRLVKGTGAGGRITKQDLEAYLAVGQAPGLPTAPPPPAPPLPPKPASSP